MPDRTKLLGLLTHLEQAEAAANQILLLDAGEDVDALAEVLGKKIEEMRTGISDLLHS